MTMISFDSFRAKSSINKVAKDNVSSRFIVDGYPSVTVDINGVSTTIAVAARYTQNAAYVYTRGAEEILAPGMSFAAKNSDYLITNEVNIIKDVNYRKYDAVICNCEVNGVKGMVTSSATTFLDVKVNSNIIFPQQEIVFVAPFTYINDKDEEVSFAIGDTIVIKNRPYLIIEANLLHSVGYYSLKPTTEVKDNADFVPEIEEDNTIAYLFAGQAHEDTTEEAFFQTTDKLNNVILKLNSVSFVIPYGIDSIKYTVKQSGIEVVKEYKIR